MSNKLFSFLVLVWFSSLALAAPEKLPDFTLYEASYILFHHFNEEHQVSVWQHIPFPSKKEQKDFWGAETGLVSAVFFSPFVEDGKNKYFLLTKTVPVGEPFECHACLPLLSAVIFSEKNHRWVVESKNLFLMYAGEYSASPKVKLVDLPGHRHGLLLTFTHYGSGEERYENIMVSAANHSVHYDRL
ncbi:MAG TPA: hypothetical protein VFU82_05840 [Gammaproteobacteria bacterium]|nr:hypothetical protein [Gammaproteobacteria bacterium]